MSVPQTIRELVERFERQLDAYRSPQYNETQLRREFLDPFFKSLGWDIDNEQGYAEAWRADLSRNLAWRNPTLTNGDRTYPRLAQQFEQAKSWRSRLSK